MQANSLIRTWYIRSQATSQVIASLDTKLVQIDTHVAQQKADQETFLQQRSEALHEVAINLLKQQQQQQLQQIGQRGKLRGGNQDDNMMDIDSGTPNSLAGAMGGDMDGGASGGGIWDRFTGKGKKYVNHDLFRCLRIRFTEADTFHFLLAVDLSLRTRRGKVGEALPRTPESEIEGRRSEIQHSLFLSPCLGQYHAIVYVEHRASWLRYLKLAARLQA